MKNHIIVVLYTQQKRDFPEIENIEWIYCDVNNEAAVYKFSGLSCIAGMVSLDVGVSNFSKEYIQSKVRFVSNEDA